jgi:hypothetical protein
MSERTREIGLRMAVTLSLIGGAIGIAMGLAGSCSIADFAQ